MKDNSQKISQKLQIKLRKIYELSQRGVEGEKENAQKMLNELLKKHNLSIDDIFPNAKYKKQKTQDKNSETRSPFFTYSAYCFYMEMELKRKLKEERIRQAKEKKRRREEEKRKLRERISVFISLLTIFVTVLVTTIIIYKY